MQVNGLYGKGASASIDTGSSMLGSYLKQTGGDIPTSLAMYNMGPGIKKYFDQHGGYSLANMQAFSRAHGGNGTGKGHWHGYGDPWYVENVLRYYK
jgi:soluble lytic murein transglycosylase-like protein